MNNKSTLKGFFLPKDFGGNFTSIDVAPNLARFYRGKNISSFFTYSIFHFVEESVQCSLKTLFC